MRDVRLVGLCGRAGSGKDHVYQYLAKHSRHEVRRLAFADGVRSEIETLLRVPPEVVWEKPYPYEVRRLLQWWGTELRRADDPNYWVTYAAQALERDLADHPHDGVTVVCFTDVRFPNEASWIRHKGGLVLEVWADHDTRKSRIGSVPDHASEQMEFIPQGRVFNDIDGAPPIFSVQDALWVGLA